MSYETETVTLKANITKTNLGIFLLHTILKHVVYLKEQIPMYVNPHHMIYLRETNVRTADRWRN